MLCVIIGNPIDGIELVGPFDNADDAEAYTDTLKNCEFWIYTMRDPNTNPDYHVSD